VSFITEVATIRWNWYSSGFEDYRFPYPRRQHLSYSQLWQLIHIYIFRKFPHGFRILPATNTR